MLGVNLGISTIAMRRSGPAFDPISLGPIGLYDPSNSLTLFADSAGSEPAIIPGGEIGMLLDRSSALAKGPELLADNTLTGWTGSNGDLTLVGDKYRIESTTTAEAQARYSASGLEIDRHYVASWNTISQSGGSAYHMIGMSVGGGGGRGGFTANGETSVIFRATATTGEFRLGTNSGVLGDYVEFSSPSLRKLAGNHLFQTASASRPTVETNGDFTYLAFDGIDDFLEISNLAVGSSHTMCVAIDLKSGAAGDASLFSLDSAVADYQLDAGVSGGFRARFNSSGLAVTNTENAAAILGNQVITLVLDAGSNTITCRINGVEQWVATGYNAGLDPIQVFRLLAGRNLAPLAGDLYAACIWSGTDISEVEKTESWAAQKMGLLL